MPSPSVSPPTDPGWLLEELTAARVLDPQTSSSLLAQFKAAGWPKPDAVGLADFLVQAGLLTRYQADQALAGESSKLILGPYLLLEPVGSGSLGTVFRALHRGNNNRFAIKLLPIRSLWNVLQAKRQVEVFAELPPHPAVVPFVDIDTASGSHYLVWPFVEGETFEQLVRRAGPLPPSHTVKFLAEVAEGLHLCHAHQIVHGLLKPSNLMLGPDRKPRILDLGVGAILSENIADDESMLDTISTANATLSSLDCCAPETVANPTVRTVPADIYALGCVLYYMLAGVYPFPDGNTVDKIIAHQTQTPVPVRTRSPRVPEALAEVVAQMLEKQPADRPATMADVRTLLLEAMPDASRSSSELPAPPLQMTAAPSPATAWVNPSHIPQAVSDGTDDSISFNVPDLQETLIGHPATAAPPEVPKSELKSLRRTSSLPDMDLPPVPVSWAQPSANSAPGLTPVVVPPIPKMPGQFWWKLAGKACFWMSPRDVIQVSIFGPIEHAPGQTSRLQIYAHPPGAFPSVQTLSRAFRPDTELLGVGYVPKHVPRGAGLGLHLHVSNAGVAQSVVRFPWQGQTRPWAFDVYVPWESPSGVTPGLLTVGLNEVQAVEVPFEVLVLPRSM